MLIVALRLAVRWRPFAVLATYLEIARLTTRGLVRAAGWQEVVKDVTADHSDEVDCGVGDDPSREDELVPRGV